jgi:hypothetical protein
MAVDNQSSTGAKHVNFGMTVFGHVTFRGHAGQALDRRIIDDESPRGRL